MVGPTEKAKYSNPAMATAVTARKIFSEGRIGDLLWEETECTARSRLRIEQIRGLTFSSSLCQNGRRLPISLGKPVSIP